MLKTITRLSAAAMSLSGLLAIPGCHAEPRPLWEIGAGLSVLAMPDYRGSDVTNVHVLPVPYLVDRGEFLKADQGGLRGLLFESERLEINISLNGTLPALDDDNPARQGMDELKPTAEVGPTADFHLWRSADRNMQSTRRGSFPVHRSEKTPGSKYSSTSGLSPRGHLERQAEFHASTQDEA